MKSTPSVEQKSINLFKPIRIAAFLFCLAMLSAGVFLPSDAQTKTRGGGQKGVVRTRVSAPKLPKSGQPATQSRDVQILSESQINADGSITPGRMLTDAPIARSVAEIMDEQASRPTQNTAGKLRPEREGPEREGLPQNPKAIAGAQWPPADKNAPTPHLSAPQTPSTQFNGATGPSETGAFPPDIMGTVGPTQFFVFLNGRMRTFNKTTGIADGVINADPDVFFSPVVTPPGSGEVSFTSDPQVRFDRLSNRWFLVIIDVTLMNSTPFATTKANRVLIAVSDAASNGTITAGTIWTLYQFQGDGTLFTDYESLGVDASALYIGGNMFTLAGSFNSTKGFVIPKAPLLTGANAAVWTFGGMVAIASGPGPFAPRGVDNYDPANTGATALGYFIGVDNETFGNLSLRRVTNPGNLVNPGPTMSANLLVSATLTTEFPVKVPHLGNTGGNNGRLDALDDRLYAAHLRNGRLWTAHNIGVNSSGTTTGTLNRNAARWYEMQNLSSATPTIFQAGTLFDDTTPNNTSQRSYWIPSIMVSGQGHVALGSSIAGTNERINAFTTGRLSGDMAGTLRDGPGGTAFPGYTNTTFAYNPTSDTGGSGGRRWGDYSFTSLDPLDDMTMWTIQEYCSAANSYGVRVVKLLAPPPVTPVTLAPSSVLAGLASTNIVITGTQPNGEGFYDPGTNLAAPALPFTHIAASVTGGVTVNSVSYTDPTHITINVSTVGATGGTKNVTVTNPDGQTATGIGVLTVTGGCSTIMLSPATLPNGTVGTGYNQAITASGGTPLYTFGLTAGGLPTGLSLSVGGALTGSPTAFGTFNFTVTATDAGLCTGAQAYSVTINAPPAINAVAVSRQQGSPVSNSTIANVSDADQAANTLTVTVNGSTTATVNGVTVSGISTSVAGVVTANVIASCTATNASFTLTVTDNASASNNATLNVTVTANTTPTLTYTNQSVAAGGTTSISPATGPSDNGSVSTVVVQSQGTYTGTISVTAAGIVSISNAKPGGVHTIMIRATDQCGAFTDASFTLTVTCATITLSPATLPAGTIGVAYNQTITASGGTAAYTFGVTLGGLPTSLSLASGGALTGTPSVGGTFNFTVTATDANGCAGTQAYSVTINTPPTINAVAVSRQQGSPVSNSTIANANDADQTANTLTVTVNSGASATVNGVTVSGISVNAAGVVTANVIAACTATNASFLLTVTDAASATATATLNVTVTANTAPTLTYANASVAAGGATSISPATGPTDNGSISTVVVQSQGTYTGAISVNSLGVVSISNAKPGGTHTITIRATDNCQAFTDASFTLTVNCQTISVSPATLPNGTTGGFYTQTVSGSGGTAPYTFNLLSGTPPTGFSLSSGGVLSGTPGATGPFSFTVQATDASGCTGSLAYAVTINSANNLPTINAVAVSRQQGSPISSSTIANVSDADQVANSLTVTVNSGATATVNGVTVSGIGINAAGVVTANVIASCAATNASFTLTVTDAASATATATLNVTVTANTAPTLTYANASVAAGGSTTVNPATGLSDNGSINTVVVQNQGTYTGTISVNGSGVVSISNAKPGGVHSITIRATDNCGAFTDAAFTLTVNCPVIMVNPPSLPAGATGQLYNQTISATGGTSPYGFAITAGTLPTNVALSPTGTLSGTTTQSGSFTFTITATDANGCSGARQYTLIICPVIGISPATLPNGFVATAYNATLTATAGTAPFSFSTTAGALPGGVTLSTGGALSGTPTTQGTFNFSITATDANGCTGARSYTVIISGNGLVFYPLPRPVRIVDTRPGQGNCDNVGTPIAAGGSLTTLARLTCEGITIPATAQAITGNLTVLNQTALTGYLTIYPDGQTAPVAANMIYAPNDILSNNFTVGLSSDGKFNVFGERTIDVVADISGYYAPPGAANPVGLYYHPLPKPVRLLDTRAGQGNCDSVSTPIPAGTSITTLARVSCDSVTIPTAAQAIVGNATVINGSGQTGYLTIYPNGVTVPLAANLIYFPGQVLSNAFTVSLNASGEFNIFGERTIDIVIDVAGYYSNEATDANGAGLLLTPLARPLRILDTRANQGNCDAVSTPITGGSSIATAGRLTCESLTIPASAQSILGNVTVLNQTQQAGYLTLYPDGVAQLLVANMIYFPGQILSNAFVVGLNAGTGQFRIFAERTLDAVVDVSGFFAP